MKSHISFLLVCSRQIVMRIKLCHELALFELHIGFILKFHYITDVCRCQKYLNLYTTYIHTTSNISAYLQKNEWEVYNCLNFKFIQKSESFYRDDMTTRMWKSAPRKGENVKNCKNRRMRWQKNVSRLFEMKSCATMQIKKFKKFSLLFFCSTRFCSLQQPEPPHCEEWRTTRN